MDQLAVIEAIRSGNPDAFREIIVQYQAGIIRYLYRMTDDRDIACDLAQDTFLIAYQGILKTEGIGNLKAWIYRIAANNALQYLRRKKIIGFISFEAVKVNDLPEHRTITGDTAEKLEVQELLKKVPDRQRTCLILHYVEGFKYREIAEILGLTEDAVRKRISRGKETFRRLYNGGDGK